MSWIQLPTRSSSDTNSAADVNQLQDNLDALKGGTLSSSPTTTIEDLSTDKVNKSTFDANTILKADTDNTPVALTVAASTLVGRASTGSIAALTKTQIRTVIEDKLYVGGTDFNVTGFGDTTTPNDGLNRAVITLKQVATGEWFASLSIDGSLDVAAASLNITLSGITFKTVSGYAQPISIFLDVIADDGNAYCSAGSGTVVMADNTGSTTTRWRVHGGDIELNAKPTWAV